MPDLIQITDSSPLLHDANCVYCHVDLELNDLVVVCDECRSPHHQECWQRNDNQCATFGCTGCGSGLASLPSTDILSDESAQRVTRTHHGSTQSSRPVPKFSRSPSFGTTVLFSFAKLVVTISIFILLFMVLPTFLIVGTVTWFPPLLQMIGFSEYLAKTIGLVFGISMIIAGTILAEKYKPARRK